MHLKLVKNNLISSNLCKYSFPSLLILGRKLWALTSMLKKLSQPYVMAGTCPLRKLLFQKMHGEIMLRQCNSLSMFSTTLTRNSLLAHCSVPSLARSYPSCSFVVPSAQFLRRHPSGGERSPTVHKSLEGSTPSLTRGPIGQFHGESSSLHPCQLSMPSSVLDKSTQTSGFLSGKQIWPAGTAGFYWTLLTCRTLPFNGRGES